MKKLRHNIHFDFILIVLFITTIIFIYSTYAWFSSTLDVTISDFRVYVDSKSDLSISLDGINFSQYIDLNLDTVINDLKNNYSNNTNLWASNGLRPVSSNGINNNYNTKFNMYYENDKTRFSRYNESNIINAKLYDESRSYDKAPYIAVDLFFKNITPSPYSDNLYLGESSSIYSLTEDNHAINALRFGFVFMNTVDENSSGNIVQSINCGNGCKDIIWDPFSTKHDEYSIDVLKKYNININDGDSYPTYALNNTGDGIKIWSGVYGSNYDIDYNYFKLQDVLTDISNPIGQLPNGITRVRMYIWIEGQDIDIIEHYSDGYEISVGLEFKKDYSSYN